MTKEQIEEIQAAFNKFQKSRERAYTPVINKALKFQVNQFIAAKLLGYTDTQALEFITSAKLYEALKPLYLDAGITYGAKHLTYLKRQKARMPIGFNQLMTDLLNNYFLVELLNTVEDITSYTKELIRNILLKAVPLGLSIGEITEQLQDIGFTYQRARTIARTETVTAANVGAMLSVKTTGLSLRKVWISATDNRTRRRPRDKYDHLHMNGVIVSYDELFNVSGDLMAQPGDRKHKANAGNIINCRCTIGFEPIRDKYGKLT